MTPAAKTASRDRYHHGDLRTALTKEAVELARAGGPDAIVLREVARRAGVSATAAYRHFVAHDDLIEEVRQLCLAELSASIAAALAELPADADPQATAVGRLRAAGTGYIRFATEQPGLFSTAFCRTDAFEKTDAFLALSQVLDGLAAVGLLDPAHRPSAEIAAWSALHGFAVLLIDGPLRRQAQEYLLDVILGGFARLSALD